HFNEFPFARYVAQDIKSELHLIRPRADDFKKYYKKIIWYLDQPIATASTLSAFLLAKKASQYVKVILNGEGADELLGGYVRYLLMLIENKLSTVPELQYYHSLARFFWTEQLFSDPAERYFSLTRRGIPPTAKPLRKIKEIFSRHSQLIDKICAADIEITLPSLLMMGDRACSAFGMENRSPFLDHRIIEFAFSLPEEMKIRDFQTKYILRKAARGIVPDKIIDRRYKKGLTTPIAHWFSSDLHSWVQALSKRFKNRRVRLTPGDTRGQYDRYLYTLINLELWFETFIDQQK
ncbi:MAG: asparagine synthase C-terminal domain-containing protein, partial [Candidatus Omnitrophica bacterium]|nr:asparagine synthase C-terminal domain-containing protein [Candidatus Omnitrophota bacterium]